jgi:hypothetical protein
MFLLVFYSKFQRFFQEMGHRILGSPPHPMGAAMQALDFEVSDHSPPASSLA